MANPNDPQNYGREVRQETYNDTDGHTSISKTTETVNGANTYKDGFVNGQVSERYQEDALASRDNENAGRGLLIGILLASLAALTAGAVWFANQNNDVAPVTPVVVPVPNRAEPSPVPETKTETTVIEKTRDVLVPVPQQQTSPVPPQQPSTTPEQNVNITVPPVTSPSPATETAPPKSDTSSSSNTQSTTTTETEPPNSDTSSSADTQSTTTTENSTTTTENSTETPATSGSN